MSSTSSPYICHITETWPFHIKIFYFQNRGRYSAFMRHNVWFCVSVCVHVCVIAGWFHLVAEWASSLWLTACSPCAWRWLGTTPGPGKHTQTHKTTALRWVKCTEKILIHIVIATLFYQLPPSHTYLLELQLCDTLVEQVSYHDLHIWITGAWGWSLGASRLDLLQRKTHHGLLITQTTSMCMNTQYLIDRSRQRAQ